MQKMASKKRLICRRGAFTWGACGLKMLSLWSLDGASWSVVTALIGSALHGDAGLVIDGAAA